MNWSNKEMFTLDIHSSLFPSICLTAVYTRAPKMIGAMTPVEKGVFKKWIVVLTSFFSEDNTLRSYSKYLYSKSQLIEHSIFPINTYEYLPFSFRTIVRHVLAKK